MPGFNMKIANPVTGIHFIGSVPLPDTETVFQYLTTNFPPSFLPRIPDGETEDHSRQTWILCQRPVFQHHADAIVNLDWSPNLTTTLPPKTIKDTDIRLGALGYDDTAIASYAKFCNLRDQGVVKPEQRFLVCLPTPTNVIAFMVMPAWKRIMESAYIQSFSTALRRIQEQIPAEDLAIQWDIPGELAYLEDCGPMPIWWQGSVEQGLIDRAVHVMAQVDPKVEMGLHLCYGDQWHTHFAQPRDLGVIVDFANKLVRQCPRSIDFLHMPVPINRNDRAYFAPLERLDVPDAEIILGLLHAEEVEAGTWKRIETAAECVPRFSIASECGYGRCTIPEWERQMQNAKAILQNGKKF